jgi:hypothetical protein
MKITHVESFRVPVPAADPPFRWRDGLAGSAPTGEGGVLRIGTDHGVEGVAFLARPGAAVMLDDLVERVFRPQLVGQDPLQREWLLHRVWELDRIHGFFSFVGNWNNFFLPYLVLPSSQQFPIQVGLNQLLSSTPSFNPVAGKGLDITSPELALAIIMAILAVLVLFLFSQRTLVSGMLAGSTKE